MNDNKNINFDTKTKIIVSSNGADGNQLGSSLSVEVKKPEFYIADTFSDPVISGFGTWIGTIISIGAAIAAYRQARKAATLTKGIQTEQNRRNIETTRRYLDQLDLTLKPIIMSAKVGRGTDIEKILTEAMTLCHQILSLPLSIDNSIIRLSVTKIEEYINKYNSSKLSSTSEQNQPGADNLTDLQRFIRNEIQTAQQNCANFLEKFASQ